MKRKPDVRCPRCGVPFVASECDPNRCDACFAPVLEIDPPQPEDE